ncbi:MAG: hypothetical protein JWM76_969, partial [Pseudonocardiales bacterium]|nr:hypothetical protein [Pseudonocardiales bacterium]
MKASMGITIQNDYQQSPVPVAAGAEAANDPSPIDDDFLIASLYRLSLVPLASPPSLAETVHSIAVLAQSAVRGADAVSLTLVSFDHSPMSSSTSESATRVDDLQRTLGEGPILLGLQAEQTIRTGAMGDDPRWPSLRAIGASSLPV